MTRIDLRAALEMLPRYHGDDTSRPRWNVTGKKLMINERKLPASVEKNVRKIMASIEELHFKPTVEMVDVYNADVNVLHRCLRVHTLMYLYRNDWRFQDWARSRLPIYIRCAGKLIIWNGTHRMTLGRLTGKKIRALVFDLAKFKKWSKGKKPGWDARVLNFGKSKPVERRKVKRRGNRK